MQHIEEEAEEADEAEEAAEEAEKAEYEEAYEAAIITMTTPMACSMPASAFRNSASFFCINLLRFLYLIKLRKVRASCIYLPMS